MVTLSYTMQDEHGATSSSDRDGDVTGTNDGPVAVADTAAATENQTLTIDVLANDTDVDDGHVFTLVTAGAGEQGPCQRGRQPAGVRPGHRLRPPGRGASETVTLATRCRTSTARLEHDRDGDVTGPTTGRWRWPTRRQATENQTLTIDVLANDTDVDDGHVFTLASSRRPARARQRGVGNQLVFDPGTRLRSPGGRRHSDGDAHYTMQDEHGATSSSTVTVTVTGTNDGPVAVADTAAGDENQTLTSMCWATTPTSTTATCSRLTTSSAPVGTAAPAWRQPAGVQSGHRLRPPGGRRDRDGDADLHDQDEHGATSSSTMTITVTGTNDGPVAVADTGAGTRTRR